MSLQDNLTTAMKEAMKAKDTLRLSTIRLVKTAVKNKEIEIGSALDDQAVIAVISTLVKQRRESAQVYRESARVDLAEKEEQELLILQDFLPAQLDEAEIKGLIEEAVLETGAASMRDMGKVMKIVSAKTLGRADGRLVSELVKARLA
ncbi:GatB/YqeY domain-containing protein [Trichloromonas sp.]|uniref:GatB/YqeY domain-containing protein n=1 Tax=Trichloromonas sp. TaxID=3069249 RepID=UPI003D815434